MVFTLAIALADVGFQTTGFDIDEERIARLKSGDSYIHEKGLDEIFKRELNQNFIPSTELADDGDVYIISVGTPVYKVPGIASPQLSPDALISAAEMVGKKLSRGNLVILRSTVPVGTTKNLVLPILEKAIRIKRRNRFPSFICSGKNSGRESRKRVTGVASVNWRIEY